MALLDFGDRGLSGKGSGVGVSWAEVSVWIGKCP